MTQVLVVDDDADICLFFATLLEKMELEAHAAQTLQEGIRLSESHHFDLVLLDLELPDGNGIELMPILRQVPSAPEVIIITGTGDARGAELAFKYEAWDFIKKPFMLDDVSLAIVRALQYRKEKLASAKIVPLVRTNIMGESDAILKCLEEVGKAAATDAGVLITGETGTGKELFARAIHDNSNRASRPFIAVDCAALPETLVESTLFGHESGAFTGAKRKQDGLIVQAHGGTLMLDEVGELPPAVQKSFLRTLQERRVRPLGGTKEIPVDIRLVAATNRDLERMVAERTFREDLLYRIRAMEIKLPRLKDRGGDIEEIVVRKVRDLSLRYKMEAKAVSSEFIVVLSDNPWPGNVRELINVLEYALASAGQDPTLFPKHLPVEYRLSGLDLAPAGTEAMAALDTTSPAAMDTLPPLNDYRSRLEKEYLKELLRRSRGNRSDACRTSGISQSRLYALLDKHGLPGFGVSG